MKQVNIKQASKNLIAGQWVLLAQSYVAVSSLGNKMRRVSINYASP